MAHDEGMCRDTRGGGDVCWQHEEGKARGVGGGGVQEADLLKVTEEEAQWLFGIPGHDALEDPIQVIPPTFPPHTHTRGNMCAHTHARGCSDGDIAPPAQDLLSGQWEPKWAARRSS